MIKTLKTRQKQTNKYIFNLNGHTTKYIQT